jgi:hypothetical protein
MMDTVAELWAAAAWWHIIIAGLAVGGLIVWTQRAIWRFKRRREVKHWRQGDQLIMYNSEKNYKLFLWTDSFILAYNEDTQSILVMNNWIDCEQISLFEVKRNLSHEKRWRYQKSLDFAKKVDAKVVDADTFVAEQKKKAPSTPVARAKASAQKAVVYESKTETELKIMLKQALAEENYEEAEAIRKSLERFR